MSACAHREDTIREIDELISEMEGCRNFGRYSNPHVTVRIKRLESEKRWIQSHASRHAPASS
jgi:hypothetical protein